MTEKTFNKEQPYDETLGKMRKEFLHLWEIRKPSNQTGIDDFDVITTLGQGSFGLVVSLFKFCVLFWKPYSLRNSSRTSHRRIFVP